MTMMMLAMMMTMMVKTMVMTMIMTKNTMKMLLPMILVMMAICFQAFYFPVVALALPMQEEMKKKDFTKLIFSKFMLHLFAYTSKEQRGVDKADYVDNVYTDDAVDNVENVDGIHLAVTRTLQKTSRVVVHL